MSTKLVLATLVLVLFPLASPAADLPGAGVPAELSVTAQPTSYAVHFQPYRIKGYGGATFGMSADEVRAVIAHDFAASAAALKDTRDPVSGVRTLTIAAAGVAPGPGTATLNYVFGAASQRLAAVNVYWIATGEATAAQRSALVDAARKVTADYVGWKWPFESAWYGRIIGQNEIVVFSAVDAAGAGLEIRLDGVDVDVQRRRASAKAPLPPMLHRLAPPGPARLRLSFVSDTKQPDVYRIPAGAF